MEFEYPCYDFLFFKDDMICNTNKIVIPISYFQNYSDRFEHCNDLKFILSNECKQIIVGIYEFCENDIIYVPKYIQEYFNIQNGDILKIRYNYNVIDKGSKCVIQAQDVNFLNINDPCQVLEKIFINYTVIYKDQVIEFNYDNITYKIKIVETSPSDIIDIIDIDLNIDFIEPVGYKEYIENLKKKEKSKIVFSANKKPLKDEKKFVPFSGKGYSLKD